MLTGIPLLRDLWLGQEHVRERDRPIRSAAEPGSGPLVPQYLYYVTMHELVHALGLGHAEPLLESTDLMGYGWNRTNMIVPVLSECDLEGIGVVFAWALEGVEPYPPTDARVLCDD